MAPHPDFPISPCEPKPLGWRCDFLHIHQRVFRKHQLRTLDDLAAAFTEYKE